MCVDFCRRIFCIMRKTCCFIGHRDIKDAERLRYAIKSTVTDLIKKGVRTFYFGSRSAFDEICLKEVTILKKDYPFIQRVYIRAEYPYISEKYKSYILTFYDDTIFPEKILNAGKARYVERNNYMIDKSDFCVFFYCCDLSADGTRSGTANAFEYATKKNKTVINLAE